tara:strand:- start:1919 stop:3241 length:1323 start_codon:yes stop_codon:yes gene_type:complete
MIKKKVFVFGRFSIISILSLILFIGLFISLSIGMVSAVAVSASDTTGTNVTISVSDAVNLYAYEVKLDFTGTAEDPVFSGFLSGTTVTGKVEGSIYAYESKLDSSQTGDTGDGDLFSIAHSGDIYLDSAIFIDSDGTETEVDYTYCSDGTCDSDEDCLSCSTDCGDCGGGGGGGGAPSKISIRGEDVFIGNKFMDVYMGLGNIKTNKIDLYNQADEPLNIKLTVKGLDNILEIDNNDLSFAISANERKTINARIISPVEAGIYAGSIDVSSGKSIQTIIVEITITESELWFDAEIAIPWDYKIIETGSPLPVQLNLLPVGLEQGFDVTAGYVIKDLEGRLWLEESKAFFIDDSYTERIDFATGNLPNGQYVLELELSYPNGVATSRSSFEVRSEVVSWPDFTGNQLIYLLLGIGILVLIIAIVLVMKSHKKIKKHRKPKK